MCAAIPAGYEPIDQPGTFLNHVSGLHWRREAERTFTCVELAEHHLNPNGTAHGGLLMTLVDITLGSTVERAFGTEDKRHPITVQVSCSLMNAARGGALLFGEAWIDHRTRTMSFASGRLHSEGRTVLTATGVFRNPV